MELWKLLRPHRKKKKTPERKLIDKVALRLKHWAAKDIQTAKSVLKQFRESKPTEQLAIGHYLKLVDGRISLSKENVERWPVPVPTGANAEPETAPVTATAAGTASVEGEQDSNCSSSSNTSSNSDDSSDSNSDDDGSVEASTCLPAPAVDLAANPMQQSQEQQQQPLQAPPVSERSPTVASAAAPQQSREQPQEQPCQTGDTAATTSTSPSADVVSATNKGKTRT